MLNSRDSLNVLTLCPIFMFRLKTHTQCPSFMCWKKLLSLSVQAQYTGSMFRLNTQAQYLSFFCAKKIAKAQCSSSRFRLNAPDLSGILQVMLPTAGITIPTKTNAALKNISATVLQRSKQYVCFFLIKIITIFKLILQFSSAVKNVFLLYTCCRKKTLR